MASAFFTDRQKVTASKAASPCEKPRRAFLYANIIKNGTQNAKFCFEYVVFADLLSAHEEKAMKTKKINILAAAAIAAAGFTGQVGAASAPFTLLPTPENNANATYGQYKDGSGNLRDAILMNGIPIAFKRFAMRRLSSTRLFSPPFCATAIGSDSSSGCHNLHGNSTRP